jgi:hypothetical protein
MAEINWEWPISFLLAAPDQIVSSAFKEDKLARDFAVLYQSENIQDRGGSRRPQNPPSGARQPRRVNFLFLNSGLQNTPEKIVADIVIMVGFQSANAERFSRFRAGGHDQQIMERFSSSALVFLEKSESSILLSWMRSILVTIAKNQNVLIEMRRISGAQNLHYDPLVDWDRPLDQIFDQLLATVRQLPNSQQISLPGNTTSGRILSAKAFSSFISNQRGSLGLRTPAPDLRRLKVLSELVNLISRAPSKSPTEQGRSRKFKGNSNRSSDEGYHGTLSLEFVKSNPPKPDPVPLDQDKSRFLQCKIRNTAAPEQVPDFLAVEDHYMAWVRIGRASEGFNSPGPAFPDQDIFKTGEEPAQPITIHFRPRGKQETQKTLMLPQKGNSEILDFSFQIDPLQVEFSADIIAFHQNRIVQAIRISYPVAKVREGNESNPMQVTVVDQGRTDMNLEDRVPFNSSINFNGIEADQPVVSGIVNNEPLRFNSSAGVENTNNRIREIIDEAAVNIDDYPADLNDPKNAALMVNLANQGSLLFKLFMKGQDITSPIQVSAYRSTFIPFPFVYDIKPPAEGAKFCDHAAKSLRAGKCGGCFDKNTQHEQYLCPFAFWSYSKVIEYHQIRSLDIKNGESDFIATSGASPGKEPLEVFSTTIHGSAARVDNETEGLRDRLAKEISTRSTTHLANDWETWTKLTEEHHPDTIVLIVHVEKHAEWQINQMEIGDGKFLPQSAISDAHISQAKRPLAIVIGCEVANMQDQGFDIGSSFIANGASIVITNFTSITGLHAATIVSKLISFFEKERGKTINFGEITLRLRQQLLAEGLIISLSLVTYGDADWTLKL